MVFFAKAQIANRTRRFIRRFMQSQYTSFHQDIYRSNVRTRTPIKRHIEITSLLFFVHLKGLMDTLVNTLYLGLKVTNSRAKYK